MKRQQERLPSALDPGLVARLPCRRIPAGLGRIAILLILPGVLGGCRRREPQSPPPEEESPAATSGYVLDLAALSRDRRTVLRALAMPHGAIAHRLGAHRVTVTAVLSSQAPGGEPRRVEQRLTLQMDGAGRYLARKEIPPDQASEVRWTGDALFLQLGWGKYLRRPARAEEPGEKAERLYGLLPAYVRLLERFITVEIGGRERHEGREGVRARLKLEASPAPPPAPPRASSRVWRRTVDARSIEGRALLDARTGVPLGVELKARWRFSPPAAAPAASGIPAAVGREAVGTMELSFTQRIDKIGQVARVTPPPADETMDTPRRLRLEIERQMLTGEIPLDPENEP